MPLLGPDLEPEACDHQGSELTIKVVCDVSESDLAPTETVRVRNGCERRRIFNGL